MRTDAELRKVEQIQKTSETLNAIAAGYGRLRWLAENDGSGAFLDLAVAAGELTTVSLAKLATMLELFERATQRPEMQEHVHVSQPRRQFKGTFH